MSSSTDMIFFQDFFPLDTKGLEQDLETVAAEAFVELANVPIVGFRIQSKKQGGKEVRAIQDGECQTHTGGIVWETAYLLASYLILKAGEVGKGKKCPLGRVLEVGAGCGMLGMIISASKLAKKVIMTETTEVIANLEKNLAQNIKPKKSSKIEDWNRCCSRDKISVRRLRWDDYSKDIDICQADNSDDLDPHSFDTIIGTDVIFTTTLVRPLLKTLRAMSHEGTQIYLCVQVRCQDSHDMLLEKAAKYGLIVNDCTKDLEPIPELEWGIAMDCKILHFKVKDSTRASIEDEKARKGSKKRKQSNEISKSTKK
jgi:predicted nicotinamide N-methyase